MKRATNYLDAWVDTQQKFVNSWLDTVRRAQLSLVKPEEEAESKARETGNRFYDMYDAWLTKTTEALAKLGEQNLDIVEQTITRGLTSSNVYMRLYEMWFPLLRAAQERALDPEAYRDLLDPAKYREILDKVFGFSPESTVDLFTQATRILQAVSDTFTDFATPWLDATYKNLQTLPQLVQGRPESLISIYRNWFDAFDKTYGTLFRVPAVGKNRERVELFFKSFDDLIAFTGKNVEYQYMLYLAGMKALENVVESIAEDIKNGEVKGFDQFFDLWIKENEKEFMRLARTPDFSKLQAELLNTGLSTRKHFSQLFELYLEDYPIALRSEMDDLYKTVYDLRKRVNELEKHNDALEQHTHKLERLVKGRSKKEVSA